MKFDKKNIDLSWGVIRYPSRTFDRIKTERPFSIGLTIWLFSIFIGLVLSYVSMKTVPEWQRFTFGQILMHPQLLLNFSLNLTSPFILAFFINFFAIKFYKCKSNYLVILLCEFFIRVIAIILNLVIMLFMIFNLPHFIFFLPFLFGIWSLILLVIAIKQVYSTSGSRAFCILLLSTLVPTVIFFTIISLVFLLFYNIPTSTGATHQYTIDWDALSQGEEGVTVMVDSDGDGLFESTFTAGDELTGDEFIAKTTPFKVYLPLVLSNFSNK